MALGAKRKNASHQMPELGSLSSSPFDGVLIVSFPDYRALHEEKCYEICSPRVIFRAITKHC
jgi:hypothetical protein